MYFELYNPKSIDASAYFHQAKMDLTLLRIYE